LYNGAQEKKICFQCEREIVKEPQYKEWNKQFIPYSDLKRNASEAKTEHSKQLSVSRIDSGLRSPAASSYSHRNYNASSQRDRGEKLSESMLLKSPTSNLESFKRTTPREIEVVSPKVGIGKKSYELVKPSIESENVSQTGVIRPNTPKKKNVFYSDYLQGYNPKSIDFKSPTAGAIKREIIERTARSYSSTSFVNPLSSRQTNQVESKRSSILDSKILHSHRAEQIETPNQETKVRTSHRKEKSPERNNENKKLISDDHERRARDNKREDLRNRMSKLSEQFFSPIKAPVVTDPRGFNTEDTSLSIDFKDNKLFRKDYPQRDSIERLSFKNPIVDDDSKLKTETNEDFKTKLTIQGYEANLASLKAHLENVEKRNGETITKLRDELRHVKEELLKERTGNKSQNQKEVVHLNEKLAELEKRLEQEQAKNKQLEERNEQNRIAADKKVADVKEEHEKTKREKDRRIDELNNQIKNLNKTQRDQTDKIHKENEAFVKKLKNEYELISRDLNKQIERQNQDIERLKEEKEDAVKNLNSKISTLQESLKFQQEINTKLRQNVEGGKVEEDVKYNPKPNSSSKPRPHFRSSYEIPSQDTS